MMLTRIYHPAHAGFNHSHHRVSRPAVAGDPDFIGIKKKVVTKNRRMPARRGEKEIFPDPFKKSFQLFLIGLETLITRRCKE
ncbi:hypothetical protein DRQ29_04835 [bacterium]|nr:MAG: hypothetical protein DRQ29_04835 [bacterium]